MKKLLIGTTNTAKIKELTEGLQPLKSMGIGLVTLKDLQINQDVQESGKTFQENALIKAKTYAEISKLTTLGDDGGLTIDILNGEPGVYSKRWKGYEASDQELIDFTLQKLNGKTGNHRKAQMRLCLCVYDPNSSATFYSEGVIEGRIAEKPTTQAMQGFPFRALFIVDRFNKYYDELTQHEHDLVNHRLQALQRLIRQLKKHYLL